MPDPNPASTLAAAAQAPPSGAARPLCVDLDGTLSAGDTAWEAFLLLARTHPLDLLRVPGWLARGRAHLKQKLFERALPNPALFPYRQDLLQWLESEKAAGRKLVLATGSDRRMADAVAAHLGIFDEVVASDGITNQTRHNKLAELERRFGKRGFDYVGNSAQDLCLWAAAGEAHVVAAPARVLAQAKASCSPARVYTYPEAGLRALLRALRPHQWVKNLLLFIPLLLAHRLGEVPRFIAAVFAFWAFSLCASSVYILNDLLDVESDRRHPTKRRRPFAAGHATAPAGLALAGGLLVAAFALSLVALPGAFTALLAVYFLLTAAYSLDLKRRLLVDVIVLAMLYTLRIVAGAAAVQVPLTMWLLAFSLFFFLSLAFAKRYAELLEVEGAGGEEAKGRNYTVNDLRIIESVGPSSGYLSVMVFCMYLDSPLVRTLYPRHELLWLACPVLLYWITRVWFVARRRALHEDPIVFALRDRVSYLAGGLMALIVLAAALPGRWPFPANDTQPQGPSALPAHVQPSADLPSSHATHP